MHLQGFQNLQSLLRGKNLINFLSMYNLLITHWYGCFLQRDAIKELTKYTRGHPGWFLLTMNHRLIVCFRLQWKNTIHQNCINFLLTKVYKFLSGYSPDLMNEVFYLRNFKVFANDNPRNKYLSNSSVYRANQPWQTPSSEIKVGLSLSKKSFFYLL